MKLLLDDRTGECQVGLGRFIVLRTEASAYPIILFHPQTTGRLVAPSFCHDVDDAGERIAVLRFESAGLD